MAPMYLCQVSLTIASGHYMGLRYARTGDARGKSLIFHDQNAVRWFSGCTVGAAFAGLVPEEICGTGSFQIGTTTGSGNNLRRTHRRETDGASHAQAALRGVSALRSRLAPVGHSALPIDPEEINDDCRIEQQNCQYDGGDHVKLPAFIRRTTAMSDGGICLSGPTLTPVSSKMRSAKT